jgi:hypothetical protein
MVGYASVMLVRPQWACGYYAGSERQRPGTTAHHSR